MTAPIILVHLQPFFVIPATCRAEAAKQRRAKAGIQRRAPCQARGRLARHKTHTACGRRPLDPAFQRDDGCSY
ncbi:MAG: hypothetical protein WC612_00690 [Bdellovibrionales bacterium]|jgi:hypothetical protein